MKNLFYCGFLVLLTFQKNFGEQFEPICPKDWYIFQDSCYLIQSIKSHWLSGYLTCESLNSDYLVIESREEADFIQSTLYYVDADIYFYLGAEDYMRRGYLKWFKSKLDISEDLLCSKQTKYQSWDLVKRSGVYDVENKCIGMVDANLKFHGVCERNCTNLDCLKLKKERYDSKILLPRDQSCALQKCANNSTCTPIPLLERLKQAQQQQQQQSPKKKSSLKYKCHCAFGFVGDLCETDVRACFTPPMPRCRNNGTCLQVSPLDPSEFECVCAYGFKGRLCEENILCENVTCLNGGLCMDGICTCAPYYSGDQCEIKGSELVVLETFSTGVSALAISCVLFYVLTIVSLDALKYIFHVEPAGLGEHRTRMRYRYALKKIDKERAMLQRRCARLARAIARLRTYRFHYMRWRSMKFIDTSTATSTSTPTQTASATPAGVSMHEVASFRTVTSSSTIHKLHSTTSIQKL